MRVSRYAPVLAVAAIQLCWVAVTVVKSFHAAGGHFTFPMDDAYIHLAMAKNLAVHGVWGVTRHAFSSTSSSPLWTLLIAACFRVAGVWAPMPLLLNLVISTILLIVVDCELNRNSIGLLARSEFLSFSSFSHHFPF
jgi:asparagine N-glycosylation enzyme membrane subunit Stt3